MMGLPTFEEKPKQVLADAGCCNETDLQALEARGVDGYVALGREGKRAVEVDGNQYPAKSRMGRKLAKKTNAFATAFIAKMEAEVEALLGQVLELFQP